MTMQRILRLVQDYGPIHHEGNLVTPKLSRSDLYVEAAPAVPGYDEFVFIRLLKDPRSTDSPVPQHMVVAARPGLYRARHKIYKRQHAELYIIEQGELIKVISTGASK